MKTKLTTTIIALLALTLTGCENPPKTSDNVLFSNSNWSVVRINDSIVVCMPNNCDKTPTVISTNAPDCPCHKKGGWHD